MSLFLLFLTGIRILITSLISLLLLKIITSKIINKLRRNEGAKLLLDIDNNSLFARKGCISIVFKRLKYFRDISDVKGIYVIILYQLPVIHK